jgi:hypothetical protein
MAMTNDNSQVLGARAQAAKYAAEFGSSETLSSWLLDLVDEWSKRDGKVYSVTQGGRCVAEKGVERGN